MDDKAYGSKAIRQAIAEEGALAVIPSRSNAGIHIPHDPDIHAQRNLVERFFCRMKDMRRLTTGYEKLKRNFLSMVHIFAIRCWLNRAHTLNSDHVVLRARRASGRLDKYRPALFHEPHGHFRLCISASGDRMDLIKLEPRPLANAWTIIAHIRILMRRPARHCYS